MTTTAIPTYANITFMDPLFAIRTAKLEPHEKALWVAALRSGVYEQGARYLRRAGKFCCLGVYAQLCANRGIVEQSEQSVDVDPVTGPIWFYGTHSAIPGPEVAHMAYEGDQIMALEGSGVFMFNPLLRLSPEQSARFHLTSMDKAIDQGHVSLTQLNDSGAFTFSEIADLIEAQL